MCEILAPAGGKNSAIAAINAGADAIYLGLSQFSARRSAENFNYKEFMEISALARAFNVKVYVAMNTLVKDSELDVFLNTLIDVWNLGADAIILSDVFLGKFIKRNYPQIKLHLSTQAGVCNVFGAKLAKKYGFERVILSRETKLIDIAAIAEIIETEVFVQGALCTCFSGQCYLSSFAGGNSGNRGRCKQPCRKKYSIDREGFNNHAYRLSLSDLCVGEDIDKLILAGVKSFKIEGRMRRPEYVAAAVKYYKNILRNALTGTDFSDLKRTYNRGNYTKGLAFGQDKSFISSAVQGHIGEFVGLIKVQNGKYICLSKQNFRKGDSFKILRNGSEVGGADFSEQIKNGFTVTSATKLYSGDKVFVTTDTAVNERLLNIQRKIPVNLIIKLCQGKRAEIKVNGIIIKGDNVLSAAKTRPLSEEEIKNCFNKTDKYPFEIIFTEILTDGVFMASSELNNLRRRTYAEYYAGISGNNNEAVEKKHELPQINNVKNKKIAVICDNFINISADIAVLKPNDYSDIKFDLNRFYGLKFIFLPPYMTGEELKNIIPAISQFDGIYCDGVWGIELAEQLNKPLFAGCGMNISNRVDVIECSAQHIALSKELTENEHKILSTEKTFALSSGVIKVMDLIYCPFGKKCASCDERKFYVITDENGRKFTLRRYKTSECRFEIYNCAYLAGKSVTGTIVNCSTVEDVQTAIKICDDTQKQQNFYKNYTHGHGNSPVQ